MRAVVAKYLSPIKDALDDLTDILHGGDVDHVNDDDDDELETALGWTRFQPDTSSFDADRVIGLPQLEHPPPPSMPTLPLGSVNWSASSLLQRKNGGPFFLTLLLTVGSQQVLGTGIVATLRSGTSGATEA